MRTVDDDINQAISDLEVAQSQLDYADKEFVNVAILKYSQAQERLNVLLKLKKSAKTQNI